MRRSALRFSGRQVDSPGCKHLRQSAFRVLGRHSRVLPQRLVANSHCRHVSASHRSGAPARAERRASNDVSHGVRLLSAYQPGRSLHRLTSPAPSALGVSHSLSGLSPPGPRGFVSRHIRPQDFGLQSLSLSISRCTFRCSLLSCRWVGKPTVDFRALLRLRIRSRATAVKRTLEPMLS
jgi:hypothetical protein